MSDANGLLIIGGSYAGLGIADAARQKGYQGPIRLVTDEQWHPYHRPPLSKAYLLGTVDPDTLPLRSEAFYASRGIDVLLNTRVDRIELPGLAHTARGTLAFDHLAIATGTRARTIPLPGAKLDGVVSLRSRSDADDIRARAAAAERIVIVGGGFIGLELAASMVKLGKHVTIIEGLGRVLSRVTNALLSAFLESQHLHNGVAIVCGAAVEAFEGQGRVTGVLTKDGARYPAELVVVAVGAVPNTELAAEAGLADANGITVDDCGRTRAPGVFAAGDCALHFNHYAQAPLRLESVQNASDQAKSTGAAIAGVEEPYRAVPWFWSDQFDLKLQMVGLSIGATSEIIRGSVEAKKFSIFYLRDGHLVGIDSINAPADHMFGRRILARRPQISANMITDLSFDLRTLL